MSSELLDTAGTLLRKLRSSYDELAVMINGIDSVMVKIVNNNVALKYSRKSYNVGLYLVKGRKVLILESSTSDLNQLSRAADDISKYVHIIEESELYAPLPEPRQVKPLGNLVDGNVVKYMGEPAKLCEVLINSAVNEGVERVSGILSLGVRSKALVSSNGFEGFEVGSEVSTYLRVFKGDYSGHWAYGSRFLDLKSIEDVGRTAAQYVSYAKGFIDIPPGRYDVILSPLVVGNLMELVVSMTSAFNVLAGFSMFISKSLGDVVATDKLTLADVPRDIELSGSTSFDDEGVETYNKELISRGSLKTLLHNSKTARKFNTVSTGNAGWITPRPWNIAVTPGDSDVDEMVREVRNGLLISNNWYTRLQSYVEGVFSTVSRDAVLVIRDGEVVGNARRVRIADNLSRLLSNIWLVGRKCYLIKWWEVEVPSKVPYILVKDLNITKPFE
jgi:PmbA protein